MSPSQDRISQYSYYMSPSQARIILGIFILHGGSLGVSPGGYLGASPGGSHGGWWTLGGFHGGSSVSEANMYVSKVSKTPTGARNFSYSYYIPEGP